MLAFLTVVSAVTIRQTDRIETLDSSGGKDCSTKLAGTFKGSPLGDFLDKLYADNTDTYNGWTGKTSSGCAAAIFLETLEEGIKAAAFFVESEKINDNSVKVKHAGKLFGEIATRSKVPVKWVLEEEVTYTFGSPGGKAKILFETYEKKRGKNFKVVDIKMTGVSMVPYRQGYNLYKRMVTESRCTDGENRDKADCAIDQIHNKETGFDAIWKEVSTDEFLSGDGHIEEVKVARVLSTLVGKKGVINQKGPKAFSQVLYSILTASAKTINDVVFFNAGSEAFFSYEVADAPGQSLEEWQALDARATSLMDDTAVGELSGMKRAFTERMAPSAISFAVGMAIQSTVDNKLTPYIGSAGDPAKFAKLARGGKNCPAGGSGWEKKDETAGCTGSAKQRVVWKLSTDKYYA